MSQRCRAVENRCVFSACMKAFCDSSGARSAGGRLFQVVGPLTAKLRCPTVTVAPMPGRVEPVEFDWMQSATSLDQAWQWHNQNKDTDTAILMATCTF